jgi:hypothetical protein
MERAAIPTLKRTRNMLIKALVPFAAVILAGSLVAQDKDPARATATGKLECGTMTISYGTPTWNDQFNAELKPGTVWRLGNNLPTKVGFDFGLKSAAGVVMPGDYMLALRYVDKAAANLVVYEGSTFYSEGLPTWEIPGTLESVKEPAKTLAINFDSAKDGTKLVVAFGPHKATFGLACVKAHPPVETTFSNAEAKFTVVQLPVDGAVKDLRVGDAKITRDGVETKWGMFLTVDGDKATLAFKNNDAKVIAKDKETVGGIVKSIKSAREKAPDDKHMEQVATMFEKQLSDLEAKEKALTRVAAEKSVEAKPTKREKPASTLEFKSDRPEGAIVFTFGVKGSDAVFKVVPSEFRKRANG